MSLVPFPITAIALVACWCTLCGASIAALIDGRTLMFAVEASAFLALVCKIRTWDRFLTMMEAGLGAIIHTAGGEQHGKGNHHGVSIDDSAGGKTELSSGSAGALGFSWFEIGAFRGFVVGAWGGAIFTPLDWEMWWQYWPFPSMVLAVVLGVLGGVVCAWFHGGSRSARLASDLKHPKQV